MFKKVILYTLILILIGGGCYIGFNIYFADPGESIFVLPFEDKLPFLEEIRKDVFTTSILRGHDETGGDLTRGGVITATNEERIAAGAPLLAHNALLEKAAQAKLDDMFQVQYFEHVSPDGKGPKDLADEAGYAYVIVGENLALGNFKDDEALVLAWMNSPGHRENILNDRYSEIGVAVGKGSFEGKTAWLAVQEFGKPESACPEVKASLKTSIDATRKESDVVERVIAAYKKELESSNPKTDDEVERYNEKVRSYNAEIARYEALSARLKRDIETYNMQVRAYNACVQS